MQRKGGPAGANSTQIHKREDQTNLHAHKVPSACTHTSRWLVPHALVQTPPQNPAQQWFPVSNISTCTLPGNAHWRCHQP
jgi:hypothetical protein